MRLTLATRLQTDADTAWAELLSPALLAYVCFPLQSLEAADPAGFPAAWSEGRYGVSVRLFGGIPAGRQTIVISFPSCPGARQMRDAGSGSLARLWDHTITITPLAAGCCLYRDDVVIEAGLLTPVVWAYACILYAWRQHRWRRLASVDFLHLRRATGGWQDLS